MFIALFSPLRVLALLLVPAIPLLQGLLFSSLTKLLVLNIAAAPSKTTVWTSTLAVGLLMAGLSWGGMKRLGKRSGRIQPFEIYKPAINDSFYYIIAALFTIVLSVPKKPMHSWTARC